MRSVPGLEEVMCLAGTRFDIPLESVGGSAGAVWGISPSFDYEVGDIALDGAGRVVMADAREAWLMWCVKAVLTEKGACLAYSDNIGTSMNWALEQTERAAQQEALINAITDALRTDPSRRTLSVGDFSFTWSADSVCISFTLLGADGYQGQVSANVDALV